MSKNYEDSRDFRKEEVIDVLALRSADEAIRTLATKFTNNIETLYCLTLSDCSETIRTLAASRIQDDSLLIAILCNHVSERVSLAAVKNLKKQSSFIRVARENRFKSVKMYALKQIENQYARAEIAAYENDEDIALEAMTTIDNADLFRMIYKARANENSLAGAIAFERLKQMSYNKMAARDNHFDVVYNCSTQEELYKCAISKELSLEVKEYAVKHITSQYYLCKVVKEAADYFVIKDALSRVKCSLFLAEYILKEKDQVLVRVALIGCDYVWAINHVFETSSNIETRNAAQGKLADLLTEFTLKLQ